MTAECAQHATLTWHGQAGFEIAGNGRRIVLDPFLSAHPRRRVAASATVPDLAGSDVVLCTHEHADHLDLPTLLALAALSPTTCFVVPAPLVSLVHSHGIARERVLPAVDGERFDFRAIPVDVVPAEHGRTVDDAYGFGRDSEGPARFVGYVVEMCGLRIYHSGDTTWWDGLDQLLRSLRIDVALLPINGRDRAREQEGIVGNLDATEAARLAVRSGAKLVVPMHWDAIEGNGGDPAELVAALAREQSTLSVLIPERGRRVTLSL